ncbi:hypothetical protein ACWIGW_39040 [Nocardia brasiliensis]
MNYGDAFASPGRKYMRHLWFARSPTGLLLLTSISIMIGISPTPARATVGCHAATCIQRDDSGQYISVLEVRIQTCQADLPGYFHAHISGPGLDHNSEELEINSGNCGDTPFRFQVDRRFRGCTDIHTDGWRRKSRGSDDYQNMGHPYLTITDGCHGLPNPVPTRSATTSTIAMHEKRSAMRLPSAYLTEIAYRTL